MRNTVCTIGRTEEQKWSKVFGVRRIPYYFYATEYRMNRRSTATRKENHTELHIVHWHHLTNEWQMTSDDVWWMVHSARCTWSSRILSSIFYFLFFNFFLSFFAPETEEREQRTELKRGYLLLRTVDFSIVRSRVVITVQFFSVVFRSRNRRERTEDGVEKRQFATLYCTVDFSIVRSRVVITTVTQYSEYNNQSLWIEGSIRTLYQHISTTSGWGQPLFFRWATALLYVQNQC